MGEGRGRGTYSPGYNLKMGGCHIARILSSVTDFPTSSVEGGALSITAENRSHPNSGGVAFDAMATTRQGRPQRRPQLWNKKPATREGTGGSAKVKYEEEEEEETKDKEYEDEDFGKFSSKM